MATPLTIDLEALKDFLIGLLNIPSPTGYTDKAMDYLERALSRFPLMVRRTAKGALVAEWAGRPGVRVRAPRALTAHVDTLGAMVKEIKDNGRLKLTKIGGFAWNTVEGEGCLVFPASGAAVRGSVLVTKASGHVFGGEVESMKRDDEGMEVRLDARTSTEKETRALGVAVGDFVAFDARVEAGEAGFIRSRHLDDKAGAACVFGAVKALHDAGAAPAQPTLFHFSHYEEVGHGASAGIPAEVVELLAVDMAAVGRGQASDEFSACICVKDSGGPYHLDMRRRLVQLAEAAAIPYKVDIYPYYGSDGEAFWRAGGDVRVGLVGPGVDASHNYERTHLESLKATAQLVAEYIRTE